MRLFLLLSALISVSCATTIKAPGGYSYKTYADAAMISVELPHVKVTMTDVNHSKVNEQWAEFSKSASTEMIKGFRNFMMIEGLVQIAGKWFDQEALASNNAKALSEAEVNANLSQYLAKEETARLGMQLEAAAAAGH